MPSPVTHTPVPDYVPFSERHALREMVTEVAHDINNPLAIIAGNAQLLLEMARVIDLDPDVAKPIGDIEEASRRLAQMVRRLDAVKEALADAPAGGDGA